MQRSCRHGCVCGKGGGDPDVFTWNVLAANALVLGLATLLFIVFAPIVVTLLLPGFDDDGTRFASTVTFLRLAAPYIAIAGLVAAASVRSTPKDASAQRHSVSSRSILS